MIYQTIEAYLQKSTLTLPRFFPQPQKRTKVLITFVNEAEDNNGLYELGENEATGEFKKLSKKILGKDKKLFSNI